MVLTLKMRILFPKLIRIGSLEDRKWLAISTKKVKGNLTA